jgi:anaerobic ribonucleoside-triphosphate reductase
MTKCENKPEVYSRIVGYFRPVQNWNEGKSKEFADRKTFGKDQALCKCTSL